MKPACIFKNLALSGALLSLVSCNTAPPVATNKTQDKKIRALETELRKRQMALDDLKERNAILEQRLLRVRQTAPMPVEAAPHHQVAAGSAAGVHSATPTSTANADLTAPAQQSSPSQTAAPASQLPSTLPPHLKAAKVEEEAKPVEEVQQTGEQRLYSKVLESYRGHKDGELQKSVQILLKTYPDSVYADNALYLAGLLAFESNDLTHSQAYMDRVLREYPNGNKSVSALFAKAMIAKRGRNFDEAKTLLQNVRKLYPGSPEAMRSSTEEKLIEMAASASKGREG